MKLLNSLLIIVGFCCLFATVTATYASNDHTVTYKNQRGSVMALNFHPGKGKNEGMLDGTVTLAIADNHNKDVSVKFPLSGYYNGNVMAVIVNFSSSRQVTAVIGHFLDNKNKIQTLSLDALQTKNTHAEDWNTNIIRSGYYTKF